MQDILDKFTSHLKNVLAKAYSLAVEMASPAINPEHLLLALLMQKGSIGGEILRKSTVSAEEVRRVLHLADEMARRDAAGEGDSSPKLSDDAKRAIEKAVLTANTNEHKYVGTEHLLSGLLQIDSPAIDAILTEQNIDLQELKDQVATVLKSTSKFPEITETFEIGKAPKKDETKSEKKAETKKPARAQKAAKTPALDFFSTDLTNPKLQERIDPVIGRDKEIERVIQVLCRRTKNNPVLLGEPGVGKTAIVEGLAKKIMKGEVPEVLQDKRILSLDLGLILAGTIYRGEFEGRLKQIIDEMKNNPDIILFVDELHNIMGAGSTSGSMDAANILKPALARGDMRCIGATTLAEYKKHIEADGALERRFQPVAVDQPSAENAVKILKGLKENYESYHGVTITDEAVEAAVELSERYITDRFLPDKAIDLIDEAAACLRVAATSESESKRAKTLEDELDKVRRKKQKAVHGENFIEALELKTKEKDLEQELKELGKKDATKAKARIGSIGRRDVAAVVARATGIPVTDLMMEEKDRLLTLEDHLHRKVVGQDEAVKAVAELVRRAKAGISHPNRPLASFLFLGPSGVGKTELAKTLAETVFQDPNALVRIDMSEFSEGFNMSKLVGAPAGYVGYRDETKLTDVVKRKPHSLVLFDEIEKAHGDVHNLLLQILEDGHVTDATGRKINFKHSIIVMTSNVGSSALRQEPMGFSTKKPGDVSAADVEESKAGVMKEVENAFKPEFINRIDKVVVFQPLTATDLESIVRLQMGELAERLAKDYRVGLAWSSPAVTRIAEKSWNPLYGARGVRRQIQDLIENPLAKELLADSYRAGDTMTVGLKDDRIVIVRKKAATKQKSHA
ncbi:MAG TPA: ATP-dependent Clp protease ATP-binding subunit [Patescibacteria group bacterium]|nr:ATP-dependent Clp protease ATP-binding subunit [Patescibacteria group bacterium]